MLNSDSLDIDSTVDLLARFPPTLDALLRGLPEPLAFSDEGSGTWRVYDVVGHLIHGERTDWIPRTRIILRSSESETFPPFDRQAHERESEGKSLSDLLDEFARLRKENLEELRALNLSPADLERRGRHPELGPVTVSQLLAAWSVHDLTHLHQISRILAQAYREAVGPWSAYLGVLRCDGHGS
jgi:hypothetical protein